MCSTKQGDRSLIFSIFKLQSKFLYLSVHLHHSRTVFKKTIQASVKVLKTRPLATWKRGYHGTKEINFKRNRALQN
ncbi:unnamed protein product [Rhizophagus irregularis]|nr:unnamed protein product [Rhizophagus irregularis]